MTEKRFTFKHINEEHISANIYDNNTFIGSVSIGAELIIYLLNELYEKYIDEFSLRETLQQDLQRVEEENKELKDLLKSMADRNNDIWLNNGQIIRLKKVFKGEWTNDCKT